MKCLCIQHISFEDLGSCGPVIKDAGFAVDMRRIGVDPIPESVVRDAELLVLLGAPLGVYDAKTHPYLADEIAWAHQRLKIGRPTLGICLGAQIMAAALGAEVYPGTEKEIGWKIINVKDGASKNPLQPLVGVPIFHMHGDNIALPAEAECLASTDLCPVQAFRVGDCALGLQFHLEIDPTRIEQWLIGHWVELQLAKVDPVVLRQDTKKFGLQISEIGPSVIRTWVRDVFRIR